MAKNAEKSASSVEQHQIVTVSFDKKDEEILQLNMDPKVSLKWEYRSMRELPEATVDRLTKQNLRSYLESMADRKVYLAKERGKKAVQAEVRLDPLGMHAERRLVIRNRPGWHPCWVRPEDFDAVVHDEGHYKVVRKAKDGDEVGAESGEILKLLDGHGGVELIAVECPETLYREHLDYVAQKGRRDYLGIKEQVFQKAEEVNRAQGNRHARVSVIDDEGDLQFD